MGRLVRLNTERHWPEYQGCQIIIEIINHNGEKYTERQNLWNDHMYHLLKTTKCTEWPWIITKFFKLPGPSQIFEKLVFLYANLQSGNPTEYSKTSKKISSPALNNLEKKFCSNCSSAAIWTTRSKDLVWRNVAKIWFDETSQRCPMHCLRKRFDKLSPSWV
jgi:hypothetical protein